MERILRLTSFEEEERTNPQLAYWLTRTPEERLSEIERLRREYIAGLKGTVRDGCPERPCEREQD